MRISHFRFWLSLTNYFRIMAGEIEWFTEKVFEL